MGDHDPMKERDPRHNFTDPAVTDAKIRANMKRVQQRKAARKRAEREEKRRQQEDNSP